MLEGLRPHPALLQAADLHRQQLELKGGPGRGAHDDAVLLLPREMGLADQEEGAGAAGRQSGTGGLAPSPAAPSWAAPQLPGGDWRGSPTSDTASERTAEVLTVWDSSSVPRSQSQNCTLPKESEVTTAPLERKAMLQMMHSRFTFCTW